MELVIVRHTKGAMEVNSNDILNFEDVRMGDALIQVFLIQFIHKYAMIVI